MANNHDAVEFTALKDAVKALNKFEFIATKIRTVGNGKGKMMDEFVAAIDALTDEQVAELEAKEIIGEVYNAATAEPEEGAAGEDTEKPAEKAPKEKKEKAPKTPKEPKAPKEKKAPGERKARVIEKDAFGSAVPSVSAEMNILLVAGTTFEEVMAKCGVSRSRILGHVKFLESNRNVQAHVDGDKVRCELKK